MFKKQALVFLVSALAFTNVAQALGLGDIELNSNLNEPLDAEIDLVQLRGLTAGEILPALASNEAFQRAGVERSFFLSNIQLEVREDENGDPVIGLSTRQPVREPFLNFLVEVNWPGGRLLKEYTLLLDPPVFDTGGTGDTLAIDPAARSGGESELTTTTRVTESESSTETTPARVEPRSDNLPAGQYRVQRNDTLWEIAVGIEAGQGYRTQQVMLAIQDLNPEAFLNNNINRLKAGSVLTLPDEAQIATRSVQQAINEVRMQNEGMAPRPQPVVGEQATEVQLSATESTSSALPEGEGERDPDGYLEVAPDDESEGASAGGESSSGAEVERLQNELAVAAELNEQFERENQELESRLNQLEEQLAIMQRLLNIQDGDAAALQQQLAEQDAAEQGSDAGESASEQAQAAEGDQQGAAGQEQGSAVTEGQDAGSETQPSKPGRSDGASPADSQDQQSGQQAQQPQQPQPAEPQPQPAADPGILGFIKDFTAPVSNWVMSSITNMIIVGAGLLILLLLPSFIRSRSKKSDEEDAELAAVTDTDLGDPGFSAEFDEDLLGDFDDEGSLDELDEQEEEETSDAIMEAEMYMAYQKYEQAEEKLKTALAEEPGRADIGMKLLEVYTETGNAAAFDDLEQRLSLSGDQQQQVEDMRERLSMSDAGSSDDYLMDLDEDMDLDFGEEETTKDNSGSPSLDELEQDLKTESGRYDLSDFETESENVEKEEPRGFESAGQGDDEDLDFSLDLDDLDVPEAESESEERSLDFDMGDLGLEEPAEPKATETRAEEDTGLDFTLDEDELGEFDSDLDFSLDETKKPSEPELPTLETEESEFDFTTLEDDIEAEPAESDELPTDDSLTEEDLETDDQDIDLESLGEPELELETETGRQSSSEDAELRDLADSLPGGADLDDDEFDFLSGSDEASTKLDLARAYIEMDDKEGARDILEEVAVEGNSEQQQQAKELMAQI